MTKTALILTTNGTEDMELIISSDVLRRGGINVTIAGLHEQPTVKLARDAILQVDKAFKSVVGADFDAIVLPGGPGSDEFCKDGRVGEILKRHASAGKIVAAICAAPTALKAHNIAAGATVTAYPSVRDKLDGFYKFVEEKVVVDGNVVTSRGPGTAFDFALKLVELLAGADKAKEVRGQMLL